MAEGKDKLSFLMYKNQRVMFEQLTDSQAGKLIKQIFKYVNCENPKETDDPMVNYGFAMIKSTLEIDLERWKDTSRKRTDAINKRWNDTKNTNEYKSIQMNTNDTDKDNDKDNDKVNDNVNVKVNTKEIISVSNDTYKESVDQNESNSKILCSLFEKFWKYYPKKVGKDKCKKWFLCKTHNIDDALVFRMIESLDKWKLTEQWQKDNGQFIPNPLTWLNRKGWEDEIKVAINTTSQSNQQQEEEPENIDISWLNS